MPEPLRGNSTVGETSNIQHRTPNIESKGGQSLVPRLGKGRPGAPTYQHGVQDSQPYQFEIEDEDDDEDDLNKGGVMKNSKFMMVGLVAVLCGCTGVAGCTSLSQAVPKTKISGDLKSGKFSVEAPKNASINGFELSYSTNETRIKFTEYKAEMDPNVVEQSGKAQAAIITATSQAIQAATEKAVEVLKK